MEFYSQCAVFVKCGMLPIVRFKTRWLNNSVERKECRLSPAAVLLPQTTLCDVHSASAGYQNMSMYTYKYKRNDIVIICISTYSLCIESLIIGDVVVFLVINKGFIYIGDAPNIYRKDQVSGTRELLITLPYIM